MNGKFHGVKMSEGRVLPKALPVDSRKKGSWNGKQKWGSEAVDAGRRCVLREIEKDLTLEGRGGKKGHEKG